MTPYYEHAGITIYHGDCREVLPNLPKLAAVVTDWPYGVDVEYGAFDDSEANVAKLVDDVWPQLALRTRLAMTCGIRMIGVFPRPTWILCWYIPAGANRTPWGFGCWQPILVFGADPHNAGKFASDTFVYHRGSDQVFGSSSGTGHGHPCPKPLSVMRWIVARTTIAADLVIDPMMGSGTTLEAAKGLGRTAIGIDIEERYCEIAAKRLSQEVLPLEFAGGSHG